jgi:hypothetical protein
MADLYSIEKLMDAKLNSMVGKPPIAWNNAKFTPDASKAFLRPRYFTQTHDDNVVVPNGFIRNDGIYQVDVFVPIDTGVAQMRTITKLVSDTFLRKMELTDGVITVLIRKVRAIHASQVDNWLVQPIEIHTVTFL